MRFSPWRIYLVIAGLVSITALLLAAYTFYESAGERERIGDSQYASCIQAGDPMREAVIRLVQDQVATSARLKPELFPDIPELVFQQLRATQQQQRREVLRDLRSVPSCEDRFGR